MNQHLPSLLVFVAFGGVGCLNLAGFPEEDCPLSNCSNQIEFDVRDADERPISKFTAFIQLDGQTQPVAKSVASATWAPS